MTTLTKRDMTRMGLSSFPKRKISKKIAGNSSTGIGKKGPDFVFVNGKTSAATLMKYQGRIEDVGPLVKSRKRDYWNENLARVVLDKTSSKCYPLPKGLNIYDPVTVVKVFGLNGIQYGGWLDYEDRLNYTAATALALSDLSILLKIPKRRIGVKKQITVSLGARGKSSALAHYEPWSNAINITRYPDKIENPFTGEITRLSDRNKLKFMTTFGGLGSYAHEFAHALDDFMGQPSGWDSTHTGIMQGSSQNIILMNNVMLKIMYSNPEKRIKTPYYKYLSDQVRQKKLSKYWIRRNELMARAFEQYIHFLAKKKGCKNVFLTQFKYGGRTYMPESQVKKIVPIFNKWMIEVRRKLR